MARTRMSRVAMLVTILALVSGAMAGDGDDGRITAQSYVVHHRPLADAVDLVSTVLTEDGSVSIQPRLKRLVVQDRPDVQRQVADLLEQFDLPPRNVEVTVSLFMGSDRREEQAGRRALPPEVYRDLQGVRETVGDFTRWTAFDPLGSRSVTCVEGSPVTANLSDDYRVVFRIASVQEGRQEKITFESFELLRVVRTADGSERTESLYHTGIVLPTGRELLVGAASGPESSRALFLKLMAKPR